MPLLLEGSHSFPGYPEGGLFLLCLMSTVKVKQKPPWDRHGRQEGGALMPCDYSRAQDPDAGKDWRREERGQQRIRWHHWLNGHEFEYAPGVGDGQGSLACCSPWGRKESDTAEQLNWLSQPLQVLIKHVKATNEHALKIFSIHRQYLGVLL